MRITTSEGLHGASDTGNGTGVAVPLESCANLMAAMTKMPQRDLHDYISEISECADVRAGSPLPFGTQEPEEGLFCHLQP